MSTPDPETFSKAWLAAFDAHDLEAVLEHFHDDVVFTSPVAARVLPETAGVVRGKAALRAYWTLALQRVPDLHFELLGVYAGVDTLVLHHRNQAGGLVCEVPTFGDYLVRQGHGAYLGTSRQVGGDATPSAPAPNRSPISCGTPASARLEASAATGRGFSTGEVTPSCRGSPATT